MTFCHECGKAVVPPSAKFCRNCGASQCEESPLPITHAIPPFTEAAPEPLSIPGNTSPSPLSRQSNLPPQVPFKPAIPKVCRTCSSPLQADEKFCGICGSARSEYDISVPHKQEIRTSATAGVCTSCGSPRFETGKFCGIFGASLDSISKPHLQPPLPKIDRSPLRQPPQPATMKVCRSCGNPLSGSELFCGICGIPIKSISNGLSASQQFNRKTCSNCGKPTRATTKSCGTCGMAVGSN